MNKNIFKIIVPVIAVVVLIESLVLVGNLDKKKETSAPVVESQPSVVIGGREEQAGKEAVTIKLVPEKASVTTGQLSYVDVNLTTKENKALDAISVFVEIDPNLVALERVETKNQLPKPILAKVSKSGNMAVVNYLISAQSGYQITPNKSESLARIYYTPVKEGKAVFKLLNADSGETESMLVETGNSQVIPFNNEDLSVSILK